MLLDTETGRLRRIKTPYSQISEVGAEPDRAVFIAGSPTTATAVVQLDLPSETVQVLRRAHKLTVNEEYLSRPEAIEFPTEGGLTAHGFYYPPRNRDFTGPQGVLPPVIIRVHGGPTSSASTALNLQTQYWTSRGFALFDLNYGGSSGYGRAYRQRLNGQWGIVDVDDAVNAARHLVREGLADQNRLIIKGGSAGGYTTLAALAFRDVFSAGVSLFGVADLEQLELNTHKFESHYLDTLVGPYPEQRRVYHERSPVHAASRISVPVILFQGLDDRVVPPEQAEIMVRAMREKGLPFAYVAFPGEGHGFRKAENIRRALDGELFFYAKVFGFDLPDEVTPVDVENLAPAATTR
jgi:dipeptidyl aminopeptidase/acylaminoacyl peptidase